MKWLITGGCGFIGTNLVQRLVAEGGHQIRVIDNLSVGTLEDLGRVCSIVELDGVTALSAQFEPTGQVQFIRGDILDAELARAVGSGAEVIVHLAANSGVDQSVANPRADCMVNVLGTLNYLESARLNGVRRFVFASSGAPVGECEPPIHEEVVPHPVSPYGASKLAGEGYCSAYFRTYDLETVALRFGNVYGPGCAHKKSVIAAFLARLLSAQELEIHGDGEQTRDFIYIDDLVDAILSAVRTHDVGGEIFQIATSTETSIRELVGVLVTLFARTGEPAPRVTYSTPRRGDVRRNFSDVAKAHRRLRWRARTGLAQGLGMTLEWYKLQQRSERQG